MIILQNYLENFLETPEEFTKLGKSMTGFFAKNHLSFEFGLDPWETDSAKVQQDIKQAQGQWDFVLINEHMAESLVILRRYLCMSVEDVACFITNARKATANSKLCSTTNSQTNPFFDLNSASSRFRRISCTASHIENVRK